ncbi:hypothetical protein [Psychrobium sp. 1_MG-2023]|uniref:hypothetical protein n=1 Tax=Psychrobium sp. 1_MG-2023 TaxID=3062624 RepID=UPI000C324790|nr:hypothetical protein [Psychrobium sp. 1_MG-2023]MDP2561619.1 hypothetical protein [Psychrobium sp. 1_MG-2023]PKF55637.1 hypothetical protein CW748_12320 [Alteromonadales bacterium alter-6D02]
MKILLLFFILLLTACSSTNQPPQKTSLTASLFAITPLSLEVAQQRGQQIYAKDRYAATATDFLLQQGVLNRQSGVIGWITELDSNKATTYFIGSTGDKPQIIFEVRFGYDDNAQGRPELVPPSTITKRLINKFKVRQLALQSIQAPCTRNYNTVVLEEQDQLIVYTLASTTEPNKIVVGGHYRFTYFKSDLKLKAKERLSRSCLTLNKSADAIPFATHILTETPLAIHAYLGMLHGEFYVSTKNGLYQAKNGNLTLIEQP